MKKSQSENGTFWSEVNRTLKVKIEKHIEDKYDFYLIQEAWSEFHCDAEEVVEFDPRSAIMPLFLPWFYYKWKPDPQDGFTQKFPQVPPAASLLTFKGIKLSAQEKRLLTATLSHPFSFFEVLSVELGQGLQVEDLLTGETYDLTEKTATQFVSPRDILFGQVVDLGPISILQAISPIIIPPINKLHILDFKSWMEEEFGSADPAVIEEESFEVLSLFNDLYQRITNPPKPVFTNTDGHLLIPHVLTYDIDDAEKVFEALRGLCFKEIRESLLADASFDASGKLSNIKFPWLGKGNKANPGWNNTVLGQISITNKLMKVEVNSKERVELFKKEVRKLLKSGIKLRSTVIESLEAQLKNYNHPKSPSLTQTDPHLKEAMIQILQEHWKAWPRKPLPVLGGDTPEKASKTKDGKRKLEILLEDFIKSCRSRPTANEEIEILKGIKKQLGIT